MNFRGGGGGLCGVILLSQWRLLHGSPAPGLAPHRPRLPLHRRFRQLGPGHDDGAGYGVLGPDLASAAGGVGGAGGQSTRKFCEAVRVWVAGSDLLWLGCHDPGLGMPNPKWPGRSVPPSKEMK